jgi:hypothetical protein
LQRIPNTSLAFLEIKATSPFKQIKSNLCPLDCEYLTKPAKMVPRALISGLGMLRLYTKAKDSQVTLMVSGNGNAGSRATPSMQHAVEAKIGVRVTVGEIITILGKNYRQYHLQVCKGADNATLKDLANKDPNKKWSYANVPMDTSEADKEKLFDQIWVDMEANMMD